MTNFFQIIFWGCVRELPMRCSVAVLQFSKGYFLPKRNFYILNIEYIFNLLICFFGTATLQHCNTFTHNPLVTSTKSFITHGHYIITDYTFLSPSRHNPGKIAPKSPPFCPNFGSKKPPFSPTFASKLTKTALNHGEKLQFWTLWEQSENSLRSLWGPSTDITDITDKR